MVIVVTLGVCVLPHFPIQGKFPYNILVFGLRISLKKTLIQKSIAYKPTSTGFREISITSQKATVLSHWLLAKSSSLMYVWHNVPALNRTLFIATSHMTRCCMEWELELCSTAFTITGTCSRITH